MRISGEFNARMEKSYQETKLGSSATDVREPILAWKVHLLREEPRKLLLIAPIVIISLLVSAIISHSPLFVAVTLFLFASALADFFFPVRYEIDTEGATARTLFGRTSIEWKRVKKYYLDDHGIKLSPLNTQSRLEAYRGVYLRFGDRREAVIEAVRRVRDAIHTDA